MQWSPGQPPLPEDSGEFHDINQQESVVRLNHVPFLLGMVEPSVSKQQTMSCPYLEGLASSPSDIEQPRLVLPTETSDSLTRLSRKFIAEAGEQDLVGGGDSDGCGEDGYILIVNTATNISGYVKSSPKELWPITLAYLHKLRHYGSDNYLKPQSFDFATKIEAQTISGPQIGLLEFCRCLWPPLRFLFYFSNVDWVFLQKTQAQKKSELSSVKGFANSSGSHSGEIVLAGCPNDGCLSLLYMTDNTTSLWLWPEIQCGCVPPEQCNGPV
ncbi:Glycine Receptor Subunit Beta [Manis pentadactyla]|nr:Glycine Receptor Subunit Beta [Manis pentadactyla]